MNGHVPYEEEFSKKVTVFYQTVLVSQTHHLCYPSWAPTRFFGIQEFGHIPINENPLRFLALLIQEDDIARTDISVEYSSIESTFMS